jgi:ABC-type lipoprotein release transport system permease subunit
MTRVQLALAGLRFYRRTHVAVAAGVACAVAVLAGSLLVGASMRRSLAALTESRLGRTDVVIAAETPFTDGLSARVASASGLAPDRVAPMLALQGSVRHDPSGRRASGVRVYGVDARFFAFHGVRDAAPSGSDAWLSPDLARELGVAEGDALVVRVPRPTDVPADTLFGAKDGAGRSMRLRARGALPADAMGEFALDAQQGPVRAVFVPLARLQRDLAIPGRVNTILAAAGDRDASGAASIAPSIDAADLGLRVETTGAPPAVLVESTAGVLPDAVVRGVQTIAAERQMDATVVLTWLATSLAVRDRATPYSLVTAIGPGAAGDAALESMLRRGTATAPAIAITDWLARDLQAREGDPLTLDYYRWSDDGRLVTERASFVVTGILPMTGLAADPRLAPVYPGITDSTTIGDWDPPFPIDLSRVRPRDDEYWREHRTTPKAFVALEVGQRLWGTRYGRATSVRLTPPAGANVTALAGEIAGALARRVDPFALGIRAIPVRRQNLAASAGATDFGAYFTYFSAFLMISALLLTTLFFRLNVEQRWVQIGVLRATGFTLSGIRTLLLIEAAIVSVVGAVAGVALAVGWAALMLYGLRVWWSGAVGTTELRLFVAPSALAIGAAAGMAAALASIVVALRGLARVSPRQLLAGGHDDVPQARRRSRAALVSAVAAASALALVVVTAASRLPAAAGFFGAGTLLTIAGLAALRAWLSRSHRPLRIATRGALLGLGLRNAAWRPTRTLTSAALVASAVFLLVSVDAFRKSASAETGRHSGTGGFALIAESSVPIAHDPGVDEGRRALGLADEVELRDVEILPARLRPGDDASCLNLYQPARPRILGVPARWIDLNPFRFKRVMDGAPESGRANPWTLLGAPDADGVVPTIADATSLEYVLHASVGDVITIDAASARPQRLRIVAALDDSMLQGELLVSEAAFTRMYPEFAGYRVLLIGIPESSVGDHAVRLDSVARAVEERMEPFGVDVQSSQARLEAYHRVENTYLSTFQALGGLGLLLGCVGLAAIVARNVLERRRELALLGATGFTGRDLQWLVIVEQGFVVLAGVAIGLIAAGVAVAPTIAARGAGPITTILIWPAFVVAAGLAASLGATRAVRRLPLVASLRSE